jgi:phage repressor protein C with HTH and peptisase S24 domain
MLSREIYKIMKISEEIINRLMNSQGYKTKKELAKNLGISAPDLNNRIKSGSVKQLLINHAINNKVNVDWLLTGQGAMLSVPTNTPVNESPAAYRETPPSTKDPSNNYLTMTAAIIGTPSIFATALKSNIEAFHSGIRLQQELAAARAMLTIHDEQLKSQRERMNTLEDLIRQKEDKKAG